jgi:uncharacterized OB-fold protein
VTIPDLLVSRCPSCTLRYLPRPGPCPKCGSSAAEPFAIPPRGTVLAATELLSPAAGWPSPHRLALVELAQGVRVLTIAEGALPAVGADVVVQRDGETYRSSLPSG